MRDELVALDGVAEEIWDAKQAFFRSTLVQLVAFKVFVGRRLSAAGYGDGAVDYVSEKTGISRSVLHDAQKMYREERLTAKSERSFIESFPERFSSWREYKMKLHGNVARGRESDGCGHCPLHCNT